MSGAEQTPAMLLAQAQDLFEQLGLTSRQVVVSHQGREYRITCDAQSFAVHRLAGSRGVPPGVSSWLVCRVDDSQSFEECDEPGLSHDPLTCQLGFDQWLDLVRDAV